MSKIPYNSYNFSISFPCGPENVDKLTKAALAEVEKLRTEGPTEEDLAKVKETFKVQRKEQLQENRFWMQQLRKAEEEGFKLSEINKFNEMVDDLEAEELQELAEEFLGSNYLLGVLMPETEEASAE